MYNARFSLANGQLAFLSGWPGDRTAQVFTRKFTKDDSMDGRGKTNQETKPSELQMVFHSARTCASPFGAVFNRAQIRQERI